MASMKSGIKRFLRSLAVFWSKVYSFRMSKRVESARNVMYTAWIGRAFGSIGKNPMIYRPLHLLGGENIFIGDNFNAGYRLRAETYNEYQGEKLNPCLVIGNNVCFNFDCHIGCVERVEIGNNVLIASRVFITDHFHGTTDSRAMLEIPPAMRKLSSKGAVIIEDDVWLGEGVCVMPGVRIGRGAVVGANAVVTKDIPPYSVAAGIPAKIIKQL